MTKKTTNLSKDQTVKEARVALAEKVLDNLNEGPGNFRPGSQAGRKQQARAVRGGQPTEKQSPKAAAAGKAKHDTMMKKKMTKHLKVPLPLSSSPRFMGKRRKNLRKPQTPERGLAVQGDQSPRKYTGSNRLRPIDAKGNNDRFRTLMQKYRTKVGPVKPKQIGGGSDNGSVGPRRRYDADGEFTVRPDAPEKKKPLALSEPKREPKMPPPLPKMPPPLPKMPPPLPKAEDPKASWKDKFKWAIRDPKKNKEIDAWNAGDSDDKPGEEKATPVRHVDTEKPRYHGRKHEPTPEIPQNQTTATEEQPKTGGTNVAAVKTAADRRRGVRTSARKDRGNQTPVRVAASTEIVKNGRMALSERVLEGLMTGASPTKTGAMAGRFLARQQAIGASPEHQQKKAQQAYRIQQKTGERQRKLADRSGILHKMKKPGEEAGYGKAGDRVAQAAKDRFGGAQAAGEGYPGGRKGSSVHQWIPDRAPKVPTDQRRRQVASTEIVKNGRMALAEKVLSELTKRDYVDDRKAVEKKVSQAKKKGKLKPKVTTVKGTSKGPEGHSRANTLGHSDAGKYDKKGKPAKNPKDRGADQSAEAVAGRTGKMSIKDINKSGVGGHRDKELSMALKSHRMKNPVPPSKKKKKKATKKSWIDDTMSDIKPTDY